MVGTALTPLDGDRQDVRSSETNLADFILASWMVGAGAAAVPAAAMQTCNDEPSLWLARGPVPVPGSSAPDASLTS